MLHFARLSAWLCSFRDARDSPFTIIFSTVFRLLSRVRIDQGIFDHDTQQERDSGTNHGAGKER